MQASIVCFSHLRWNFVFQRPQHILSRLVKYHRIFYVEEPIFEDIVESNYTLQCNSAGIIIVNIHLPNGLSAEQQERAQREVIDHLFNALQVKDYILWYYAPMAFAFTDHLRPRYIVYDCMDELSAFLFAPASLTENEARLMQRAHLVFTGGHSLYQAKRGLHRNIHCFPSSIDKDHFGKARISGSEPADQLSIPYPRIGFFGVIDERLDIDLLREVAERRPDWNFVLVGPVVKIDPASLPQRPNIHYLGQRPYSELPAYLSGWNIAMMPFASANPSTKYISPTKTPEYLAGGRPVIAPSIADVVHPYADLGLVVIADTPAAFVAAAENILQEGRSEQWLRKVDSYLADLSWDQTVNNMRALLKKGLSAYTNSSIKTPSSYV